MWTIGGVRIYVTDYQEQGKAIIARLQPVVSRTVLHNFGYESKIYQLTGKVVGLTNVNAITAMADAATSVGLLTAENTTISGWISSVSMTRDPFVWQSLDTSQDCATPVFTVTFEMYVD